MTEKAAAVVALFPGPGALLEAVGKLKGKGLGRLEAYTPYPVRGLSEALGHRPSPLGWMVFGMGLLGAVLALLFQWWTSAVDYPVRIGGKALFSWQAFVPVVFEVMVLFAAFTAGLGMLHVLNRLPRFGHPILASKAIAAVTRDRFALAVEAGEEGLDASAAAAALREAGGEAVEVLPVPAVPARRPAVPLRELLAVAAACAAAGAIVYYGIRLYPVLPPMSHMEVQGKAVPYRPDPSLGAGDAMRLPVEGTVARGHLPSPVAGAEEAGEYLEDPLPRTADVLARGRAAYGTFCQVCHGPLGDGKGSLGQAYGGQPASFHTSTVRGYPDGRIFHVIGRGRNAMPGYAGEIAPDDRWAVVHYVRALQRSRNARDGDLP